MKSYTTHKHKDFDQYGSQDCTETRKSLGWTLSYIFMCRGPVFKNPIHYGVTLLSIVKHTYMLDYI